MNIEQNLEKLLRPLKDTAVETAIVRTTRSPPTR